MERHITKYLVLILIFQTLSCSDLEENKSGSSIIGFWEVIPLDNTLDSNQTCFVEINEATCVYWLEKVGYPFPNYYLIENDSIFFWKENPTPTPREFRGIVKVMTDTTFTIEGAEPKIMFVQSDFKKFKNKTGEVCWNCSAN